MQLNEDDERRLMRAWLNSVIAFLCMLAALAIACLWSGCSTTKYIPVESKAMKTDTVYLSKLRVDSVFLHDSISVVSKGDTVEITRVRDRVKTIERVDTIFRTARDSVEVQVPYPVERELTKWEQTKMDFGGLALGGLCVVCVIAVFVWIVKTKGRR